VLPDDLPVEGVEIEHRYVDARGLLMHAALAGPEGGDPVVLVHGWPQHWWIWRDVIPRLVEAGYRCICLDLRGHGWTDAPPDGYEKEQFASDILAALDELGIQRFKMVGHDWGAFAGLLMALRAPERMEKLLALSIIHPWIRRDGGPVSFAKQLLGASYQFVIASPVLGRQVVQRSPLIKTALSRGASHPIAEKAVDSYAERWKEPDRAAATVQIYRTLLLREIGAILGGRYRDQRLRVPTLLVYGNRDPVIRGERLRGWEEHADDMRIEEIDGGHFLPDEQPAIVADRALALFAQ
jgi:pimeloyl-ACP methyl ester carboxylesterase